MDERIQSFSSSARLYKKYALIIIFVCLIGVIIGVFIAQALKKDVPTIPFPTRSLISPTDMIVLPTENDEEIPKAPHVQCNTASDCSSMDYCTERVGRYPECHTFICMRGICQEAKDEVGQENRSR